MPDKLLPRKWTEGTYESRLTAIQDWARRMRERHPETYRVPAVEEDLHACPVCGGYGFIGGGVNGIGVAYNMWGPKVMCPQCNGERQREKRPHPLIIVAATLRAFTPLCADHRLREVQGCPSCQKLFDALNASLAFAHNVEAPPWLVFLGPFGSGKTHLLTAAARAWQEQHDRKTVWVKRTAEFLRDIFATMQPDAGMTEEEMMDAYIRVPLLALDELGRESQSEASKNRLSLLLNERYEQRRPTIIAANMNWGEIKTRWPDIESRMQDRSVVTVQELWGVPDARRVKLP